ncbi:hypothetical protein GCM10022377_26810 [Zhihengliuella alba]|uniref:Uncharacterized protein n=1 Tax=Zhihengliuella alba TaxID=547018 RepID=A0ABP7E4D3_9MICC
MDRVEQTTSLPAAEVFDRLLRILVAATGAGVIYGVLARGSVGGCQLVAPAAPSAPGCMQLTMEPSGWIYLVMALVAIVLISSALRFAANEAAAVRSLRITAIVVSAIPLVALVVAHVFFRFVPFEDWQYGEDFTYFVPFVAIEQELT